MTSDHEVIRQWVESRNLILTDIRTPEPGWLGVSARNPLTSRGHLWAWREGGRAPDHRILPPLPWHDQGFLWCDLELDLAECAHPKICRFRGP